MQIHRTQSPKNPHESDYLLMPGGKPSGYASLDQLESQKIHTPAPDRCKLGVLLCGKIICGLVIFPLGLYWLCKSGKKEARPKQSSLPPFGQHAHSSAIRRTLATPPSDKPSSMCRIQKTLAAVPHCFSLEFIQMSTKLETELFPTYQIQEISLGRGQRYTRMHIACSLLFSELLMRICIANKQHVNRTQVRAEVSCSRLERKGTPDPVLKDSIESALIDDGIYLDTRNQSGASSLVEDELICFKDRALENQIFIETSQFFAETEEAQFNGLFSKNEGFMNKLFEILSKSRAKYPLLSTLVPTRQGV